MRMVCKRKSIIILFTVLALLVVSTIVFTLRSNKNFNSQRAFRDLEFQVNIGSRTPNSDAHSKVIDYITNELMLYGWQVEDQIGSSNGRTLHNIIAKRGSGEKWVILGAHYDSRIFADNDPDPNNQLSSVPGANDGASGVAVLLELGRSLPKSLDKEIWLVFFDLEDQGGIGNFNWIEGSRYFALNLLAKPDAVIVVDMVGDIDLNLFKESNSSPILLKEIWTTAASLGYQNSFLPEEKHSILDDHIPFLENGIEAIVIIDIEYEYWHTISDTIDKTSAESLRIVGETLYNWLITK